MKINRTYTVKYRGEQLSGLQFGDTIALEGFDPDAGIGNKRVDRILFNGLAYLEPQTKNVATGDKWYFYCPDATLAEGPTEPKYHITLTPISGKDKKFNFLVGEITPVAIGQDEDEVFGAESGGSGNEGGWFEKLRRWWHK